MGIEKLCLGPFVFPSPSISNLPPETEKVAIAVFPDYPDKNGPSISFVANALLNYPSVYGNKPW